ncbi:MAG TPA: ATP-binding protein [Myxococcota bacterium]|nr:ATP-binding protein [Myxococcota bacterium]
MCDLDESVESPRPPAGQREAASAGLRTTLASELEGPLTAALGYADLVLESAGNHVERKRVEGIRRHGHKLLALVREIAASERAQAGMHAASLLEANPRATIELVVEEFRSPCEERGLRLWSDMRPVLPQRAMFDSLRLRHALRLVLDSALAHTRKGGISVRAGWRAPDRGEIEVIDTSPGPSLKEFERLTRALDTAAGGVESSSSADGIGLALARRIARVLGGDLEYERAPNARGVYRLRFALRPVATDDLARRPSWLRLPETRLRGRVLVAEACAETRCLLRRILEEIGLEVATAETGRGAVDAALHGSFDLVLLGLGMHVMDGFGAVAALRHVGCSAPVIALAAPEEAGLGERSRGFGFDAFLLQPLNRMSVLELVARHVRGRIAPRSNAGSA